MILHDHVLETRVTLITSDNDPFVSGGWQITNLADDSVVALGAVAPSLQYAEALDSCLDAVGRALAALPVQQPLPF